MIEELEVDEKIKTNFFCELYHIYLKNFLYLWRVNLKLCIVNALRKNQ